MFKKSAAAFMVLVSLLLCGTAFAATEIKLSNQFPPSHHVSKGLVVFAEKVAEHSKGELSVKIFDSAQLFKDTEIVEALQDALIDAGLVPVNKWSGMIPAADVFEMPFVFKDLESPKKFLAQGRTRSSTGVPEKRRQNTLLGPYGYIQFFNNKRPLKMPADFQGPPCAHSQRRR